MIQSMGGKGMFVWFDAGKCADLMIDSAEHISLQRAAEDLARDVAKVSGLRMLKKPYLPTQEGRAVVVGSLENPAFAAWVKDCVDVDALKAEWEGYRISISERFLIVAGTDRRGAMWGVYYLTKNVLGVDPCYLFTGSRPEKKEKLELKEGTLCGAPKTYRFRGWFLNDED